jgi:hypothetical protein
VKLARNAAGHPVRSLATLLLVAAAASGFLLTRAGRVDLAYAGLNPVRDPAIAAGLLDGSLTGAERQRHLARGTALAAETLYLPPHVVLRALSIGFRPAVADLLFVRAHSYFLTHFFTDRTFTWLDNYFQAIADLDPDNPRIYLWAAQVVKLGQAIDDDVIRRSNTFLERGLERFPRDWRLHMDLGFNLNFEFKGRSEAERAAALLRARDHFATAAGLPGAPVDPNFLVDLFHRDQEDRLAAAYALQKYYEATDEQREQLLRRVGALSREMAAGIQDEEARWKRDMPYASVPMFALIGDPRQAGALPQVLEALVRREGE